MCMRWRNCSPAGDGVPECGLMPEVESLLTIRDVQRVLSVGKDAAYALVASGSIPCIRLGTAARLIRVRPEALRLFLTESESGPSQGGRIGWTSAPTRHDGGR